MTPLALGRRGAAPAPAPAVGGSVALPTAILAVILTVILVAGCGADDGGAAGGTGSPAASSSAVPSPSPSIPPVLGVRPPDVPVAGAPLDVVAPDGLGPVLLVPGYGGGTGPLAPLADRLRDGGRTVTVLELPDGGTGDLREAADTVDRAAREILAEGGSPWLDVVGYSAGGVIVRLWLAGLGANPDGRVAGDQVTRRVVTIGSPHHGAQVAALAATIAPGRCPTACRQLVPGSELFQELAEVDETPAGPRWTSVWSSSDEVVSPPGTSRLAGAANVELQNLCGEDVEVDHSELPGYETVMGIVLTSLTPGEPGGVTDCSTLTALGAS